mmetsp:Transcript_58140/g.103749  ORF Transcript_58140/g.103749 Transcript_58140/m.103749 type:complete len:419 (-) Transcript_58140:346-1602(-)
MAANCSSSCPVAFRSRFNSTSFSSVASCRLTTSALTCRYLSLIARAASLYLTMFLPAFARLSLPPPVALARRLRLLRRDATRDPERGLRDPDRGRPCEEGEAGPASSLGIRLLALRNPPSVVGLSDTDPKDASGSVPALSRNPGKAQPSSVNQSVISWGSSAGSSGSGRGLSITGSGAARIGPSHTVQVFSGSHRPQTGAGMTTSTVLITVSTTGLLGCEAGRLRPEDGEGGMKRRWEPCEPGAVLGVVRRGWLNSSWGVMSRDAVWTSTSTISGRPTNRCWARRTIRLILGECPRPFAASHGGRGGESVCTSISRAFGRFVLVPFVFISGFRTRGGVAGGGWQASSSRRVSSSSKFRCGGTLTSEFSMYSWISVILFRMASWYSLTACSCFRVSRRAGSASAFSVSAPKDPLTNSPK